MMSVLFMLVPVYPSVWNGMVRLSLPNNAFDGLKLERLQSVEGALTGVSPDRHLIRIATPEGSELEFLYNDHTQVEIVSGAVVGCFGPNYNRRVRFSSVGRRGVVLGSSCLLTVPPLSGRACSPINFTYYQLKIEMEVHNEKNVSITADACFDSVDSL